MRAEATELWLALVGGLVISLATTLHLLLKGRITGMSSLVSGILGNYGSTWKISLLTGMIVTSCIAWLIFGFEPINDGKTYIFSPPATTIAGLDLLGFALAGLLVGTGTKLSNGCTSGHGVCGLPRLSARSFTAVFVFMALGLGLATLRLHEPFLASTDGLNVTSKLNLNVIVPVILGLTIVLYAGYILYLRKKHESINRSDLIVSFFVGILFAVGLITSGMIKREKVLAFIGIGENWDPSLGIVFAAAVIPNFVTFHLILDQEKPVYADEFELSTETRISGSLLAGASLFGLGWGLAGICPGPAYVLAPIVTPHISLIFLASFLTGYYLVMTIQEKRNEQAQAANPNHLYSSGLQGSVRQSTQQYSSYNLQNSKRLV